MEMKNDVSPIPLEYASPSKPRSFQDAFSEFVQEEISAGNLKPLATKWRIAIWTLLASAILFAIAIAVFHS